MVRRLPRTVVVLGGVSLCNDLASEMVTPLIPVLLAAVLGAGPLALGLVEGLAEAVAAWLKLWAGRRSDLWGGRRKNFILGGYLLSNLVRPLLALAAVWPVVVCLRAADRVGKGLRTAPRDALLAEATPEQQRGLAYGFHRAMDNGGAMAGALLAAACLAWTPASLPQVILLSALPGLLAVGLVAFGIHDGKAPAAPTPLPPLVWRRLPAELRRVLPVVGLFTLARTSEAFIILRGHELNAGLPELLLLWAAINLAKSFSALVGGRISDTLGHHRATVLGWTAYALGLALLIGTDHREMLWSAGIAYGLLAGLGEGSERALIAQLAGQEGKGTAFGWYNAVVGLAALPAGLLFGWVWSRLGAPMAFAVAAALAGISIVLLARSRAGR